MQWNGKQVINIFSREMWLFDFFFLDSAILISLDTDISKYFRESLGLRENESRLYTSNIWFLWKKNRKILYGYLSYLELWINWFSFCLKVNLQPTVWVHIKLQSVNWLTTMMVHSDWVFDQRNQEDTCYRWNMEGSMCKVNTDVQSFSYEWHFHIYSGLSLSQTPKDQIFQFEITVVWENRSWNVKNTKQN